MTVAYFAIAFATVLCNGDEPASIVFHQYNMRKHLTCLQNEKLAPFPEHSHKRRVKAAKQDSLCIHCTCRLPDRGDSNDTVCQVQELVSYHMLKTYPSNFSKTIVDMTTFVVVDCV